MKLLEGITVIDFSQFLSGPSASLRLSDFGARVIKIEKKGSGDICRQLYVSEIKIANESTLFHTINRNKESFAADLKDEKDKNRVSKLIKNADVLMHNFRPGVMERLGFSYEKVQQINSKIIYASISGYGDEGEWKKLPGQDLLLQSLTGLPYLNGESTKLPTPMGISVVDILAGTHLAQGILAALVKLDNTGNGSLVQVSMLESALDFQFEVFTTFLNDGEELPERSEKNHAHSYVGAPYGVYKTKNGYLALAMGSIPKLAELLDCIELGKFSDSKQWFIKRDVIKAVLANHLKINTTQHWLNILEPADVWCAKVFSMEELRQEEGYKLLDMEMSVKTSKGETIRTTRCPIKINGKKLNSEVGAPFLGEHNDSIAREFNL
ncbi:CaiB/BaiF CoA transferase family protein [Zunongwangia endophytica]|uniref:CaiB/BaiF CoA transferase family protein n=1 Tax=Zunongwangia endophytica TaxID=1808945 RepID=A0ABV8H9N9_9FLAO|nr:CaiB/BaiF CoA-transferase family protein [Zunongwangia endophytica]MDN3594850.1 CaiB/BaiF CoA-transferase family protein [Zunongwangia endophytica]